MYFLGGMFALPTWLRHSTRFIGCDPLRNYNYYYNYNYYLAIWQLTMLTGA